MKTKIKLFDIYVFLITLFKGFGAESNNKGYVLAFVIGCIAMDATAKYMESYYLNRWRTV